MAQDGGTQIERLEHVDPGSRCYRYTMESTGLPVADYVAELRIHAIDGSSCTVQWASDFTVTSGDEQEGIGIVDGFLSAGVDELRRRYASQG